MPVMAPDVGIDLGTETTCVYVRGRGIVISEPTLVVLERENRKSVRAVGDEASFLYGRSPDELVAVSPIRNGQIADFDLTELMLRYFLRKAIGASYLNKPLRKSTLPSGSDLPPISEIEGVDLVTEGVVTLSRVEEYASDALENNELYTQWAYGRDGASLISQILFEEATDINFYVGKAVNPAHQNPDLPINFNIKMSIVDKLSADLEKMGKRIKVSYF